ncbi:Hypothetical predicted protein [Pelobates cultripes]|uniref:Uncharacterized protein n=1 Tax=Pelobates cultripes TaxID=61616 RepID=A0AAD1QXV3_PELCU|nr:Hypothetical predicted protein [Pelobates cultripes]
MATKRTKAQVSSTPSSHPLPSKTSLRRFFTEKQETDMRSKMAAAEKSPASSAPASPAPSESSTEGTDIKSILTQLPSKLDLEAMFSKMERSFGDKLQSLHEEVSHIGNRVQLLEEGGETIALQIHNMQTLQQTQNEALIFLQRKIEDLDNRGRRNNLRIRGIPEAPEGTNENITQTLTNLFNQHLGRPVDTPIKLDRAHRAIRPKVLANETPRDIICRIHHFPIKEMILQKAKQIRDITFSDRKVQIFQDLAQSTLIARRALRPITKALSDRNIRFHWAYPFSLVVNRPREDALDINSGGCLDVPTSSGHTYRCGGRLDWPIHGTGQAIVLEGQMAAQPQETREAGSLRKRTAHDTKRKCHETDLIDLLYPFTLLKMPKTQRRLPQSTPS